MKIVKLSLKNLNSIRGEWQIDFQDPLYSQEGIFAIVGPTGAGKTTILDAICLALYGQTPRLSEVSKGQNEILNKQSSDCYAEVEFTSHQGHFLCKWSQRRSRNRLDGNLQAPEHHLFIYNNQGEAQAITSKASETKKKVEEVTGLNALRFQQSILLAQGKFAQLLLAKEDERSALLEQITGTQIYSDISKSVYQHTQVADQALSQLQNQLAGQKVLSPSERQALAADIAQWQDQSAQLQLQLSQLQQTQNWMEQAEQNQQNRQKHHQAWLDLQQQQAEFAPHAQQLTRLKAAQSLSSQAQTLEHLAQQIELNNQEKALLNQQQQKLHQQLHTLDQKLAQAKAQFTSMAQHYEQQAPALAEAQKIDIAIQGLSQVRQKNEHRLRQLHQQIQQQQDKIQEVHQQQNALQQQLQDLEQSLSQYPQWEQQNQNLPQIHTSVKQLQNLQQQQQKLQDKRQRKTEKLSQLQVKLTDDRQKYLQQKLRLETTKAAMDAADAALKSTGTNQQQLQQAITASYLQQQTLSQKGFKLRELLQAYEALQKTLDDKVSCQHQITACQTQMISQQRQVDDSQRALDQAQGAAKMFDQVMLLLQARAQLQPGQPCPLCGSLDHPAPLEALDALSPDQAQIEHLQQQHQQAKEQLQALQTQLLSHQQRLSLLKNQAKQQNDQYQQRLASENYPANAHLQQLLNQHQQQLTQLQWQHQTLEQSQRQHSQLEAAYNQAKDDHSKAKEALQSIELAGKDSKAEESKLQENLQEIQQEITQNQQQLHQAWQELHHLCQAINLAPPSDILSLEAWLEAVKQQTKSAEKQQKSLQKLQEHFALAQQEQRNLQQHLQHLTQEAQGLAEDTLQQKQQETSLSHQRKALYAGDNAQQALEKLQTDYRQAQEAQHTLNTQKTALNSRSESLAQQALKLAEKLNQQQAQQQQLTQQLSQMAAPLGFANLTELHQALGQKQQLQIWQEKAQLLSQVAGQWQSQQQQLQEVANHLLQQAENLLIPSEAQAFLSGENPAKNHQAWQNLKEKQQQLQEQRDNAQQQLGACEKTLAEDSLRQKQLEQDLQKLATLHEDAAYWQELNRIIGSADGKKFRNYAQGLTFKQLLFYANHYLRMIFERYELLSDPKENLGFLLIDHYQGDAQREVENLSGGESFIVSLSLALGLSDLASKSFRVDSLFLDEGFGTLDYDTLELVLQALDGIQRSGKMVGVISHVSELKARIPLQISVEPSAQGTSRLAGPGVQSLS